jgi:hypothetical protein
MQFRDPVVIDRVRVLATSEQSNSALRQLAVKVLGAWLRPPRPARLPGMAADGVVFPKDDAHILHDLLNWP